MWYNKKYECEICYEKERNIVNMDDNTIFISSDDVEIVNAEGYSTEVAECFGNVPDIAKPLVNGAKKSFKMIENMLYSSPSLVNALKAALPEETFQAILSDDQKQKIAKGALKLMTKKDGSLMANLVDNNTKKIVSTISLKSVKIAPEMTQAMASYATQMQMAQIAEQIQVVQLAVEEVRMGQEYDRLAMAYSCQQKLLQAMTIKNPELRRHQLLRIACDAEDSRNLLMQSQNANVNFIKNEPESFWSKVIQGATTEKVNSRICEIRESLCALNMVSLAEAIAYQEMSESEAARLSLEYYAGYIDNTYLSTKGFVERLDMIDPSPTKYWSKTLPNIKKKIQALPCVEEQLMIRGDEDEENG